MKIEELNTGAVNTWCPGCGNFGLERAFKQAVAELVDEKFKLENFVLLSGIGCHAKIVDYIKLNSFYSLHGRTVPALHVARWHPASHCPRGHDQAGQRIRIHQVPQAVH